MKILKITKKLKEAGEVLGISLFQGLQHILICFSGILMVPIVLVRTTNLSIEEVEYVIFATLII